LKTEKDKCDRSKNPRKCQDRFDQAIKFIADKTKQVMS